MEVSEPAVNYQVGNGPVSIQVGDVNNDGKLESCRIKRQTDGTVGVLLGKGDGGRFRLRIDEVFRDPASESSHWIFFNGDGKLDAAVAVPAPRKWVVSLWPCCWAMEPAPFRPR